MRKVWLDERAEDEGNCLAARKNVTSQRIVLEERKRT